MASPPTAPTAEELALLKKTLTRLRKAKADKPVGFCYCQEGETGEPVLLAARPGKKKIPNGEITALRRTAKNKSRLCEGLAWRDPESGILQFHVIKGKYHAGQFKKDARKLGRLVGVMLGSVAILPFSEKERAQLGQELLQEAEEESRQARAAADAATTPEARAAALSSILDLEDRERAEYISGAGTAAEEHAHGLGQRIKSFFSRKKKDDDDGEPTDADKWAFHQQMRADHVEELAVLSQRWGLLWQEHTRLQAPWTTQEGRFADIQRRVAAARGGQLSPTDGTALSQEASGVLSEMETLDTRHSQLRGALLPLADQLEALLEAELGTVPLRRRESPTHDAEILAWQAETRAAQGRWQAPLEALRALDDEAGPRITTRRQQAQQIRADSARLHLSGDDIAAEDRLQQGLQDARTQQKSHQDRIVEVQASAAAVDERVEQKERERRELQRELHDVEEKLSGRMMRSGTRRALELVLSKHRRSMAALEADIAAAGEEKTALLVALQDARRQAAAQEDGVLAAEEDLARHRAGVQARVAQQADQHFTDLLASTPAKEQDARHEEAQVQLQRSRQAVGDAREAKKAAGRRVEDLRRQVAVDPLAAQDVRAAQERLLQARADVESHRTYAAQVRAAFPDASVLAADPVLAGEVAAKRAAMDAEQARREQALSQAEAGTTQARIATQARTLKQRRMAAEQQHTQVKAAGKEVAGQLRQLEQDLEALSSLPSGAVRDARTRKLSASRKALIASHKTLRKRYDKQGQAVEAALAAEVAFFQQHAGMLGELERTGEAERQRLQAELDAEERRLAEETARLEAAQSTLAQDETTATTCREALERSVLADPQLRKGLLHAEAMAQQEDETAALERLREAQRLARANREEVLALETEALQARSRASASFAMLKDAEDIYEAGVVRGDDGLSLLERLSGAGESDPDRRAEKQRAYEQVVVASNKIINQVERMKALGEPPERYLPLLDPIPRAFWPDRLVAESKDYAEIEGLFAEEDQADRQKTAQQETLAQLAKSGVDVAADTGMVIANVVLCDLDLLGIMGGLGKDGEGANIAVDTAQAWQAVSILGALAAAKPIVEKLLAQAYTMPEGLSDVELRKLREDLDRTGFEKLKAMGGDIANFLDASDFALASNKALLGGPLLSGSGVLLPGPGIVFGLINTACKLKVAAEAAKKASGDQDLLAEMKETSAEDANLLRAMGNRTARSRRLRNEAIVDATVAGTNTVATVGNTIPGGQVVAAAGWAVSATIASVKAAWTAGVDWKAAADAKETLKKARLGSRRAMMEIFDHHQKYASMLMLLRARDGSDAAVKFCCSRGLERGEVLDSKASLALLRKLLLEADKQSDDPGRTFQESAGRAWDLLSKGARVVASVATGGLSEVAMAEAARQKKAREEDADVARRQIKVSAAPSETWFSTQEKLVDNIVVQAQRRGTPCATAARSLRDLKAGLPRTREQWQSLQAELQDTRRWRPEHFSEAQAEMLEYFPGYLARLAAQDRVLDEKIAAVG